MKVVYIAGPFRGKDSWEIKQNINRAAALALECWRAGYVALCPHTNTADFQGAAPDNVWLEGDLELLSRCDALLTTDNWKESQCACKEVEFAQLRGIPIFHSLVQMQIDFPVYELLD